MGTTTDLSPGANEDTVRPCGLQMVHKQPLKQGRTRSTVDRVLSPPPALAQFSPKSIDGYNSNGNKRENAEKESERFGYKHT